MWRTVLVALVMLAAQAVGAAAARAQNYAGLGQPGPPLTPTAAQLSASLSCEPSVAHAKVEPVLLNPGTSTTPSENFGWNWEPALDMLGIPWCAYTAPNQTLGPIDISGEYLAHAIRAEYKLAGRRIAIIGHSQGGMSMRWALRFWPDTRRMVADIVGLEADNHGTTAVTAAECQQLGCPPADWQQVSTSNFIAALNSRSMTFPGISYTELYSTHDELATPDSGPKNCTSCLPSGSGKQVANIELQSICPGDASDHVLAGTTDPVAYALGVDAITHPGPANPGRISRSVCSQPFMPGVYSPASAAAGLAALQAGLGSLGIIPGPVANPISGAPVLHAEPALPCYVFAACSPYGTLRVKVTPGHATAHRRVRLHVLVTVDVAGVLLPVPDATVSVGGAHRSHTGSKGRTNITLTFDKSGQYYVIATAKEFRAGRAPVQVRPSSSSSPGGPLQEALGMA